jgi:hypothetical protein
MNSNFDLNINNYTFQELEDLFELPKNYDPSIIEIKETKLRQNIVNDQNINAITKNNTLAFIKEVKHKLVESIKKFSSENLAKNYYNTDKSLHNSETITSGSTQIIKQPVTPYAQSMPSEFYQGTINPLSKRILRQNINIDTRFRENYYTTLASNFHLDLPIRLNQVVSLQLSAMEIPSTFYVISRVFGNNFFTIESPGLDPFIITIPDGNYDYLSLQNYINNFILVNGGPTYSLLNVIIDANTPSGATNGGSGKMVIGSTTGTLQFSLNFLTDEYGNPDNQTPLPLKLGWLFGFRNGYYENNTTYIAEGLVNLDGPRYIYLVVDDFNNNVNDGFYGAFNSSILNKNILARISLQGTVFSLQNQNNLSLITTPRQYFGPVDIQKLQIQLLDEYGRILNLNNMDYSFCLTFQTVYDL